MLIPDVWYAVLESNEVKPGKPYAFKRLGQELVFWRDKDGCMVVMEDRCPHRRSKLSPGKIVDGNLQCHFHGFQYDREGACQLVPANGRNGPKPRVFRCGVLPSREAHGFVWVWNGEPRETYPPVPYFDDLAGFTHNTLQLHWNVDYSRAIEALLDVSHLPFVHAKTIGREQKTLVNGPYTTLQNNMLRVWISNQPDEGLPALMPSQVPPQERPADLAFNFPNVWELRIADAIRAVQILAPVDEENVVLYLRSYHKLTHIPVVREALAYVSNLYNRMVAGEDELIVVSQDPKMADLDVGEKFIPGDRPIALYLQHRRRLILGLTGEMKVNMAEPTDLQAATLEMSEAG